MTPDQDMLEMQARLREDPDGRERDRLLALLASGATDLKRQADRGVSPAEFRAIEAKMEAAEAAAAVIATAWNRFHSSRR